MNLAQIRDRHRLRIIEDKIADCCEERALISYFLSENVETTRKEHYELRRDELGVEITLLWIEFRKLLEVCEVGTSSNLF
jgi:hypothetical protein